MSSSDPQTDISPGDELVAYLDGELSPDDCRRVEQRLAADADYRQQLRELDQAWEALDALPKSIVNDNFAHTTIEMVNLVAERDLADVKGKTAAASRRRFWGLSAAVLAAALGGFVAARALLPNPNDKLLADLPVIQQFDLLSQIDDIEFLRGLPAVLPIEQLAHDEASLERQLAAIHAASVRDPQARREWLANLRPEEKASLQGQAKRFSELEHNSAEQQWLRELEREISTAGDAGELRKTLLVYGRWLAQQLPGDQEDLRVLPTDKRLKLIREIVREENERASRRLSAEDAAKLRDEIMEIFQERKDDFLRYVRRRERDNRPRFEGTDARRALMVLSWVLRSDDRDDETRKRLINELSPEAQQHLERVGRRDGARHQFQLWRWILESMQPHWGPGELERFFANDLDNNQRERLLSLPADEMQSQLERMYLATQLGLRGPEEVLGEFGSRGGRSPAPSADESRRSTDDRSRGGGTDRSRDPPRSRDNER
jgi:hypothetical protein